MTIASQTTAETMLGDGENREFPFTFQAWEGEIRVVLTDPQNLNLDVTGLADIQIAKDSPGGVVTYPAADGAAPLPSGWKLTVLRNMNFLQAVRLVNATRYDPLVIEQALDRLVATDQQLKEQSERALSVAIGAATIPQEMLDQVFEAKKDAVQAAGQADASAAAAAISEARADQAIVDAEAAVSLAEDAAGGATASATAALDSENRAYQWAQNPEDVPVRENPDSSENEYSAYHWAKKAEVGNVPTATEVDEGVVRFGTAAEHAAGLNGVAAQPGRVRDMLFTGSTLKSSILPVATTAALGGVKPDGTTITVDGAGAISAAVTPSALAAKLDVSVYNADAPKRILASGRINSNGSIAYGINIASCTVLGTGRRSITMAIAASSANYEVFATIDGGANLNFNNVINFGIDSRTTFRIGIYAGSSVWADRDFNFIVVGN